MSDFRKALMITAIPVVALSIISTAGMAASGTWSMREGFSFVGVGSAGLWGIAILAAIGFAIMRKRQIAAGIIAGAGIGAVALGVTCFAAVFTAF